METPLGVVLCKQMRKKELDPRVLRRSSRSQAKNDDHTLEKTTRMAAKMNLEVLGKSFTTFSDSRISSNLNRVGINLGSDYSFVLASTVAIKKLEINRMVVCAKQKKTSKNNHKPLEVSDEERESRLDVVLDHISGNLNENTHEQKIDQLIDLSSVNRRKKASKAKNTKTGQLAKKPKTPSKVVMR